MSTVTISCLAVSVSALSFIVSVLSLAFSRHPWRETYQPIITARVSTVAGGNIAIMYNLIVENIGNRPAANIRLGVDPKILSAALKPACADSTEQITNCFDPQYMIPVLANGRSISTAFGKTSEDSECMWIYDSCFPLTIRYRTLEGRKYRSGVTLCIRDDTGFAGHHYAKSEV